MTAVRVLDAIDISGRLVKLVISLCCLVTGSAVCALSIDENPTDVALNDTAQAGAARIASLNLCLDQMLLALVPRERIVSLTFLAADPATSVFADRVGDIHLNRGLAEELIPLQPDLILAGEYNAGGAVSMLRRLGFRVETLALPRRLQDIREHIRAVGELLDARPQADRMLKAMDRQLPALALERQRTSPACTPGSRQQPSDCRPPAQRRLSQNSSQKSSQGLPQQVEQQLAQHLAQQRIQEPAQEIPQSGERRKIRALFYSANGVTFGADTLEDELLTLAGFENLAATMGVTGIAQLPLERLVQWQPERLVINDPADVGFSLAQDYLRHPVLTRLMPPEHHIRLPSAMSVCSAPFIVPLIEALRAQGYPENQVVRADSGTDNAGSAVREQGTSSP